MSGALKEALIRIRTQLKLAPAEKWGPKVTHVYKPVAVQVQTLEDLPPIQEMERFEMPSIEIKEEDYSAISGSTFAESQYSPGVKLRPTRPSMIKGVNEELYSIAFSSRVVHSKPHFNCKWFQVTYFDPQHYISKIAKSSPSLLVTFSNNNIFNQQKPINMNDVSSKFHNVAFPFKLATGRHRMKKMLRERIFETYNKDPQLFDMFGGSLKFTLKLYPHAPEQEKEFNACVHKALQTIFCVPREKLMEDVKLYDRKIPWRATEKIMAKFGKKALKPYYEAHHSGTKKAAKK